MLRWQQLRDVYGNFTAEMIGKSMDDFASRNFLDQVRNGYTPNCAQSTWMAKWSIHLAKQQNYQQ